ncbi:sigma-70 family RNA polymerase sigma factor [Pseudothauera nasutitermitis]|uniref:Sigma-70 family RNA polymerase sigma factor n=1 Tax=Pseudothauera nasutitermitis TaxID=2565930 RepID=A0A4S4AX69_9RHOO|nr:sigma-70 family RNA polymerase sigma factor [Pseudothauera nasutitermitis]THF64673.1 sigma-70 family RNA polymerase sigma factor [Pseudothauera nasutitermitis]
MNPPAPCTAPTTADVSPNGASDGLLAVFQHQYGALLRYVARRLGNGDDAQEVVQELGARLSLGTEQTRPDNPRAYLFAMAHNMAADHLRQLQRKRQLFVAHAGDALPEPEGHASADTLDRHLHREALREVALALHALPERTREIFLLSRAEGIGHDELAVRYGVTRSTIEREVIRATDRLHNALGHWRGDAPAGLAERGRKRRSLQALLGMLVLGVGAGGAAWQAQRESRVEWRQAWRNPQRWAQPYGLPDGSQIVLDAGSAAEIVFEAGRRHVRLLRGSAWFDVAHAPERPFVVDMADVRVTVLGTRFAVESERTAQDDGWIEVHVAAGRVAVTPRGWRAWLSGEREVVLGAAQRMRIVPGLPWQAAPAQAGAAEEVAPWRNGRIGFSRVPLKEAVQRLARYHDRSVQVDETVAALPVSGDVRLDRVEDWLRALPAALPVELRDTAAGFFIDASTIPARPLG